MPRRVTVLLSALLAVGAAGAVASTVAGSASSGAAPQLAAALPAVAPTQLPTVSEDVRVAPRPVVLPTHRTAVTKPARRPAQHRASRSRALASRRVLPLDWAALARCESGGAPHSVSASGTYRGLYQFSRSTWASVGGIGDPAQASPEEQTYRASLLYARSGRSSWPVCGTHL